MAVNHQRVVSFQLSLAQSQGKSFPSSLESVLFLVLSAGILQDGVKSTGSGMGQNKVHSTMSASSNPTGAGEEEDQISAPES